MYLAENGSTPIFLAIFYIKTYNSSCTNEWIYTIAQIIELGFIVFAAVLNFYTIYMALSTNLFHFNITLIYSIFTLHWVELIVAKLFVLPYEEGFLSLTSSFEFAPQEEQSLLQYTFDDTVDYEHTRRAYISLISVISSEVLATVAALSTTYQYITPMVLAILAALLQAFSYIGFLAISETTKWLETKCEQNVNFYSLSVKFQLTETVRTLKVIHFLIFVVAVMIIIVAGIVVLAHLDLLSSQYTLYVFVIFEKLLHV
uniref:Uncharacterized protein n=1 Tax=Caenorhabditis japonica TaxID=281687 RepID=A0A8R1EDJ3_CAEJA